MSDAYQSGIRTVQRVKAARRPLEIGDAVKRRGPFEVVGAVVDKRGNWCSIAWPKGAKMPKICDEGELEMIAL